MVIILTLILFVSSTICWFFIDYFQPSTWRMRLSARKAIVRFMESDYICQLEDVYWDDQRLYSRAIPQRSWRLRLYRCYEIRSASSLEELCANICEWMKEKTNHEWSVQAVLDGRELILVRDDFPQEADKDEIDRLFE